MLRMNSTGLQENRHVDELSSLEWKRPGSIIAFLHDFKAACDVCNIHEDPEKCLFKHHLDGHIESLTKARVMLPTERAPAQEVFLMSYSTIVNFLLNR